MVAVGQWQQQRQQHLFPNAFRGGLYGPDNNLQAAAPGLAGYRMALQLLGGELKACHCGFMKLIRGQVIVFSKGSVKVERFPPALIHLAPRPVRHGQGSLFQIRSVTQLRAYYLKLIRLSSMHYAFLFLFRFSFQSYVLQLSRRGVLYERQF